MNTLTYYVPFCNKKFAFIDSFISFDDNLSLFSTGVDFRKCRMKRQESARRRAGVCRWARVRSRGSLSRSCLLREQAPVNAR